MIAVHQTIFTSTEGNCWSAALASLLELPLIDVPNFVKDFGMEYSSEAVQLFLMHRGYFLLEIKLPTVSRGKDKVRKGRRLRRGSDIRYDGVPQGAWCMAYGKSMRGEWYHVVVGYVKNRCFEMVHDPQPDGLGIDGLPTTLAFIVPLNPAQMERKK